MVRDLRIEKIRKLEKRVDIYLINRTKVTYKEYVEIGIQYKDYKSVERFMILDNPLVNVLIGNKIIKKIRKKEENSFPVECRINSPDNKIVSWTRPINNEKKRKGLQECVDKLLKEGKIEPSKSLWCHPVVVVEKKSGKFRFTMDMVKLNNIVELDEFELPKISEITRDLYEAKVFSIIDFKDRFWQLPLRKSDKKRSLF